MDQKKTGLLIIISVIAIVLVLGGIWYWQSQKGKFVSPQEKPKVVGPEEKPVGKIEINTSTWLPYVIGHIQFRYPADWKIEEQEVTLGAIKQKNFFKSALAQTQKTVVEITLIPPTKQSEKDVIKIGGKLKNCKELGADYKCEEKIDIPVYTASKSDKILQAFDNLIETFDIYFEVADIDTGIAIDQVKITAKYVPAMTSEEFRTGTYKYCFECLIKEGDAIRRCSDKCGTSEEKVFTDKQEFRRYLETGPLGTYIYTVEAKGYKTMSSYIIKSKELLKFGNTMMMSPVSFAYNQPREDVPELREEYIRSLLKPGTVLVIGFVVDDIFRKPLEGVKVSIPKLNLTTTTNGRGFYFLNIPEYNGRIDSCEKMIETALTYIYSKDGFKIFEHGQDYPINLKGPDVRMPYYLKLNTTMFYGKGRIIQEYMPPGACQSIR